MVRVQNDGDAVRRGNGSDKVSGGNSACNRRLLLVVRQTLSCEKGSTSLRDLQNDGRLVVASGFHGGICRAARRHVEGRDGKLVFAGIVKHLVHVLAVDDTGGNNVEETHCEFLLAHGGATQVQRSDRSPHTRYSLARQAAWTPTHKKEERGV